MLGAEGEIKAVDKLVLDRGASASATMANIKKVAEGILIRTIAAADAVIDPKVKDEKGKAITDDYTALVNMNSSISVGLGDVKSPNPARAKAAAAFRACYKEHLTKISDVMDAIVKVRLTADDTRADAEKALLASTDHRVADGESTIKLVVAAAMATFAAIDRVKATKKIDKAAEDIAVSITKYDIIQPFLYGAAKEMVEATGMATTFATKDRFDALAGMAAIKDIVTVALKDAPTSEYRDNLIAINALISRVMGDEVLVSEYSITPSHADMIAREREKAADSPKTGKGR